MTTVHAHVKLPIDMPPGFGLVVPSERCCNCGTSNGVQMVTTPFRQTVYMGLGGTELTLNFDFPYCATCAKTASRVPPTTGKKFLVFAVWFAAFFLGLLIALASADKYVDGWIMAGAAAVCSTGLTAAYYGFRRPKGTQSSADQPVRLAKIERKFVSGAIPRIVFKFTNPAYRDEFRKMNEAGIKAGFLGVAS